MKYNLVIVVFVFFLLWSNNTTIAKNSAYNPLDYGLASASNGEERFWVLYHTHELAKKNNSKVSYEGVGSIEIDIPFNAPSIPLSSYTDFCDLVLTVGCNYDNYVLFEFTQNVSEIPINKFSIDNGTYKDYPELAKGLYLLQLVDENLWVKQRVGFDYGHQRMDVVLVKDGKAKNKTVFPYNNDETNLTAKYCKVTPEKKQFKNIVFRRKQGNAKIASLLLIDHQFNVNLDNISIFTPSDTLYADQAIIVVNSNNIVFNNIIIEGTYSRPDAYGYGITMNNVYGVKFYKLYGRASWGIFGNNNINNVALKECDINRFDVHCYGRDIVFENCSFHDLYNQFSSINGTVVFSNCSFFDFIPFQYETTYNAYTRFDLTFNNCTVYASKEKNYLIDARGILGIETDERSELKFQCYPNLIISGLTVHAENVTKSYYVYNQGWNILTKRGKIPGVIKIKKVNVISNGEKGELKLGTIDAVLSELKTGAFIIGGATCGGLCLYANRKKKKKDKQSLINEIGTM